MLLLQLLFLLLLLLTLFPLNIYVFTTSCLLKVLVFGPSTFPSPQDKSSIFSFFRPTSCVRYLSHPGSGPARATRHRLPHFSSHNPGSENGMCIPIRRRSIRSTTSSSSSSSSFYAPSASSSTKEFTSSIHFYYDLCRNRDARSLAVPAGFLGEMIYPAARASNNITHPSCSSTAFVGAVNTPPQIISHQANKRQQQRLEVNNPANQRQQRQRKTRASLAGLKRNMSTRFGSGRRDDGNNDNESSGSNDKKREKAREKEEFRHLENKLLQQLNMRIMKEEEEEKECDGHGDITSGGGLSGSMNRARTLRRKQYEEMFGLGSGGDDGVNEVKDVSSRDPVEKESKKPLNCQKTQKHADETRVMNIGGKPKEWRQRSYEEAFGENASEGKVY